MDAVDRPSRTELRIQESRDRVISATWSLLATRPWAEITVADICEQADVVPRTFYRYFGDKAELLFADAERYERATADALAAHRSDSRPPAELVLAVVAVLAPWFERLGRQHMRRRLEVIGHDPELAARDRLKRLRVESLVADALGARDDVDEATARVWAAVTVAIFYEAVHQWAFGTAPLERCLRTAFSVAAAVTGPAD